MSLFAVIERLSAIVKEEINNELNSKQEAEALLSELKKIQVGLQDAESKEATDSNVRDWLQQIENVAYEMDNVLDEWEMVNRQVQSQRSEDDLSDLWEKVYNFVSSLCFCFQDALGHREMAQKMKALRDRVDVLWERGRYNFVPTNDETTSDIDIELKICGRDSDKKILLEKMLSKGGRDSDKKNLFKKLLSKSGEEGSTQIISIVGRGGVGKTTLAQLVYNDAKVKENFELKAWISIPHTFDTLVVAIKILEAYGGKTLTNIPTTLLDLVQKIKKIVEKTKFLLVLDNVWTEDRVKWNPLKNCLKGVPGSKILLTTRSELVAAVMGTTQSLQLSPLSDKDCEAILGGIALDGRSKGQPMDGHENLRKIGTEIAKKCNGVPLAATSMGSMLAGKKLEEQWENVLKNPLWKSKEVDDLYRPLKLSYADLSPVLKRCFLSCIIFPKGSLINVDELIMVWMAYGYLGLHDSLSVARSKGLMFFEKLMKRSFFQKPESDDENYQRRNLFKVHDVMHDFAISLCGTEYFFIADGQTEERGSSLLQRYLNNPPTSLGRIRTFCASNVPLEELSLGHLEGLSFGDLECVRLLRISECNLLELPQEVGKLFHLRYLNLSDNPIQELPETLSDLYNLQTLVLENCFTLCKLPEGIGKLMNLRHLLNSGTLSLLRFPRGLEKLTGLWTLSEFRASTTSELGVLNNLNKLQGSLFLTLPLLDGTVDDTEEVRKANLKNKIGLGRLKLVFHRSQKQTYHVKDALQPPPNLQCLEVTDPSGDRLSHWIDNHNIPFDNLKVVVFKGLRRYDLPPFGKLPALEDLKIVGCEFERLGVEFFRTSQGGLKNSESCWFPRLKKLAFVSCREWQEWEDIGEPAPVLILPCLRQLQILQCTSLTALPHNLLRRVDSLQFLEIHSINLGKLYNKNGGSNWDKIRHIPRVDTWVGA